MGADMNTEDLRKMAEVVRGVGTTGKKIGRYVEEGASQGKVKARRISLVCMLMHNQADRDTVMEDLVEEGPEDYHSLTSTGTAQVGHGSEVCTQARPCWQESKDLDH